MRGTCGIHAVMLRAEKAMRDNLASVTLAQTAEGFAGKAPASYFTEVGDLIAERQGERTRRRRDGPDTS
jgi:DNA-binding IscR family transcriptional regulator